MLHDGDGTTCDHKGLDLPDTEAAQIEALDLWKRILRERAVSGQDRQHWHVAILDGYGALLAPVPYPEESEAWGELPVWEGC